MGAADTTPPESEYIFKVTEAISPDATPAAPLKLAGETFTNEATGVSVTAGGVVSTVKVDVALLVVFPAWSDCSAWAVYTPSLRASVRPTVHVVAVGVTTSVRTGLPDVPSPE